MTLKRNTNLQANRRYNFNEIGNETQFNTLII